MAQVIGKFDVCAVQRTYQDQQGNQKTHSERVGKITRFDNGGEILELYMFPGTKFSIFPQREQGQQQSNGNVPF